MNKFYYNNFESIISGALFFNPHKAERELQDVQLREQQWGQKLIDAAHRGQFFVYQKIVRLYPQVASYRDISGNTALHIWAGKHDLISLKLLINQYIQSGLPLTQRNYHQGQWRCRIPFIGTYWRNMNWKHENLLHRILAQYGTQKKLSSGESRCMGEIVETLIKQGVSPHEKNALNKVPLAYIENKQIRDDIGKIVAHWEQKEIQRQREIMELIDAASVIL